MSVPRNTQKVGTPHATPHAAYGSRSHLTLPPHAATSRSQGPHAASVGSRGGLLEQPLDGTPFWRCMSCSHKVARELHRLAEGNMDPALGPLCLPDLFARRMLDKLRICPKLLSAKSRVDALCVRPGASTTSICPPIAQIHSLPWPTQRTLSESLYRPKLISLKIRVGLISRPHEAWIRSCEGYGAAAWLRAVPMIHCFMRSLQQCMLSCCSNVAVLARY